MASIYPETSLKLRRQVSSREWVDMVSRRHLATFVASTLFHLYLIFFNPQLQTIPSLHTLTSSPEWLYLFISTAVSFAAFFGIWTLRKSLVARGSMGIMRHTWIDLIFILLPIIPSYLPALSVHGIPRYLTGLSAIAFTIYVMLNSDRILWRYHIKELRARQISMLGPAKRSSVKHGLWSVVLGFGLIIMLIYNGGQDYNIPIPVMPRFFRACYVIFCTCILIRTIVHSLSECYWSAASRDLSVAKAGFMGKFFLSIRLLPCSFWLTCISFFVSAGLFITESGNLLMAAVVICHFFGCSFIHHAYSFNLQKDDNRFVEWLFRHPALMVVFSFILLIAVGTYLLSLPFSSAEDNICISTINSLFTATSAVCVTGLSVIDVGTQLSLPGQFILAALIQLGGLGIMTISSFVALAVGHRMGILESGALADMNGEQRSLAAKKMTKAIVTMTFGIELAGTLIFLLFFYLKPGYLGEDGFNFFEALWQSFFMALNAFCNSGFALRADSYSAYTSDFLPLMNASLLIFLGGIGYGVIANCWQSMTSSRKHYLRTHTKIALTVTAILIVSATLLMFILEYHNPETIGTFSWHDKLINSLFQTTCARTAGMNSIDMSKLTSCSEMLFIALMFIGAAPGSTGGGIKVTSIGIIFMLLRSIYKGDRELVINKTTIPARTIHEAIIVLLLGLVTVSLGTFGLAAAMPDVSLQDLLFEVTSAMGTVGLSNGVTQMLDSYGKVIIIAIMFIGRVGFLTFLSTVCTRRSTSIVRYPYGKVTIG